jgi:hypothetical protein
MGKKERKESKMSSLLPFFPLLEIITNPKNHFGVCQNPVQAYLS